MDLISAAQQKIRHRPLFAGREFDNLKKGLGCTGIDFLRALEGMAKEQPAGWPVAADDAPELFQIQSIEVAPEHHTTYPRLDALSDGLPPNLQERSGLTHRRPAIQLFNSRAKGLIFGFYREIPILMKEHAGKLYPFPGVMSDRIRLLNSIGGLDVDLDDLPVLDRPAIFFVDFDWVNFCHWLSDWVIGLNWLCAGGGRKPNDFQYVFDRKPKSFNVETLKMLGVDEGNIHFPERAQTQYLFRVDNVIATSLGSPTFRHAFYSGAGWALDFARRTLIKSTADKSPPRFVISRQSRGLVFSDAAKALLASRGFVQVTPEKLSLTDQVRLFSKAEAILAPHGAGLTNIAFCRPGTKIFEVFNRSYGSHAFFTIAAHSGLQYVCASCEEPAGVSNPAIAQDAFVTEDVLRTWFERAGI